MAIKPNQIYKRNCFDLVRELKEESVQLALIDPPSGAGLTKEFWDEKTVPALYALKYSEFLLNLQPKLKKTASVYISQWVGEKNPLHMIELMKYINNVCSLLTFKEMITWSKQRGNGNRKGYLQTNEHLLWYVRDNKKFTWNKKEQYLDEKRAYNIIGSRNKSDYKRITTVWTDIVEQGLGTSPGKFAKKRKEFGKSATPKPIEFYRRQILLHTKKGDLVFIPFSGSGVAEKACLELGRFFIGCDLYGPPPPEKRIIKEGLQLPGKNN